MRVSRNDRRSSATASGPEENRHGPGHGPRARPLTDGRQELTRQNDLLRLMVSSPRLQRQCACGAPSAGGATCSACEGKASLAEDASPSPQTQTTGELLQRQMGQESPHDTPEAGWRNHGGQRARPGTLSIGSPHDPQEREADRVAAAIVSLPKPSNRGGTPLRIQRWSRQMAGTPTQVPASVSRVLQTPGRQLDTALQRDMGERFGVDFSRVRIHVGPEAEQSAKDVNALAYTVKQDIVFGPGQFQPATLQGRRLLAHELTHVVQQRESHEPVLQRSLAGCQDLIRNPSAISRLSGTVVHRIIGEHFRQTVSGARNVYIPGASAGPLRSQALCGGDDAVIQPQLLGGMSGAGIPDLARRTPGGILQVAEIKPAAIECLVDGEEQLLRYIDQGNARDPAQVSWRAAQGVSVVSPMPESVYSPPNFTVTAPGMGRAELRTAWCTPGLLAYSVSASAEENIRVPVPQAQREASRRTLRNEAQSRAVPIAVGLGATAVAAVAGRALWRHFWRVVIQRFAIRGAIALGLSAADGPLPFGELVSLGLGVVTAVQIIQDWNDLWREADRVAAEEA
jgi:hypothetical protein